MFRGISTLNLDAKGRFAIPTKYRERLVESCASQLVITVDKDRCLLIYPEPVWVEMEKKLKALPSFNKATRILQRLYIGHAHEVEMDGQGRVLLPPSLRSFAGLEKRVALVGQGERFELWNEDVWDKQRDDWLENVDLDDLDLPPELASLSI
ncbi:MAG: division/cell wall cluster transcriptional repressor MraZ [Pseudomonadota bacterium]